MTSRIARAQTSTLTYHAETVPASLAISPSSFSIGQGDTKTPDVLFLAASGRPLALSPTSWELVSGTGLTLNTSTGLITGVDDGGSIVVKAHYAPQSLTSNTTTAACSALTGVSTAALAVLNAIVDGGAAALIKINHLKPGITPLITDSSSPSAYAAGWVAESSTPSVVDFPAMPYGKAWSHTVVHGIESAPDVDGLHITAMTRGTRTFLTISENVNTMFAADPRGSVNYPGGSINYTNPNLSYPPTVFKNFNGDRLSWLNGVPGAAIFTSVGMIPVIIDDHTIELRKGELPGPFGDPLDSTSWADLVVGSPAPVLRWAGGNGHGTIRTLPDGDASTVLPRVLYFRFVVSFQEDYYCETLGSKMTDIDTWPRISSNDGYGARAPWTAFSITTDDEDPALGMNMCPINFYPFVYSADTLNGNPSTNATGPNYSPAITRGTPNTTETIVVFPATRGDEATFYCYQDGVLQTNAGSPAGTSFTMRRQPSNGVHFADRFGSLRLDATYGGGGGFGPRDLVRHYGEAFLAGAWTNVLEAPDHFDLSIDSSAPYHASSLIQVRACLKDGNNRAVDQVANWQDTTAGGSLPLLLVLSGTHGEVQEGLKITDTANAPQFVIPVRLSSFTGSTTITLTLNRFRNGAFDGVTYTGSVSLTVVP